MKKCSGGYDGVPEYQLLVRAFTEQVFVEEDGSLRLKTAEDGEMNSLLSPLAYAVPIYKTLLTTYSIYSR